MGAPPGFSGRTSWIIWLRSPRLKSAVAKVAVLTVFSFSRVSTFRFVIIQVPDFLSVQDSRPA